MKWIKKKNQKRLQNQKDLQAKQTLYQKYKGRTMNFIEIPVIKVSQSSWNMYVGVMRAKDLYSIAEVDRIRLEGLKIPKYAGYQRALAEDRVDSIRDYLSTPNSTFPNAIIVSIDSEYIENWDDIEQTKCSILKLVNEKGAARIIDGQHRSAALDAAEENFNVIVTVFIDLDIFKCAQIFSKINSTQKTVNPSIAFQLFGYSNFRSPQKTAHDIAEILNTTEGSPFYKKLLMLGTKDEWSQGRLSQSTFCKHLMDLYTKNWEEDENRLLRSEKLEIYPNYPLRELFVYEKDKEIMKIIWKYFYNIAKTWETQWNDKTGRSILIKTTGYAAFIAVLKKWLLSSRKEEILEDKGVDIALGKIKTAYETEKKEFLQKNYPAGLVGVQLLRESLLADLEL
ncbi:MAG: DGQHR domain-containing protein [Candidatus Omnitrophota bacterium]